MKTTQKYSVITGASQGLGRSICFELARRRHNLLLIAKADENLPELADRLAKNYHTDIQFLEVDFTQVNSIEKIDAWLNKYNVNMLINNAGIGGTNYFHNCSFDAFDSIISVNIRTLVLITRSIIENLKQNAPSYILNISSMASCCPIAFKTIYPASKSFVYSFSRSLGEELKNDNIHVSVVLPGAFRSNSNVCKRIAISNWWNKTGCLTTNHMAYLIIKQLLKYKKVIIPGILNKINWLILKVLPYTICIPAISKSVKKELQLIG
nr:SDR family NAD(P)-dependent oxidoreductase [uncultured Carboxylicivirga sp.]